MIDGQEARNALNRALRRVGLEVRRYRHSAMPYRRARLLADERIDVVVDVGANTGQSSIELRDAGYRGRILSFEPGPRAFAELADRARADGRWEAVQVALGAEDGRATFHLAEDPVASSLRPPGPRHLDLSSAARTVESFEVPVTTLDGVLADRVGPAERLHLKIDVQGFEREVLQGASATLARAETVEVELCFVPLYPGQALIDEVLTSLYAAGFELRWFEPAAVRGDRALWGDGLLVRTATSPPA